MKHALKLLIPFVLITAICFPAYANVEPYKNYLYDTNLVAQEEPQAYMPDSLITGGSLGTKEFDEPMDVFVAPDKRVYIVDSGNNRILILTKDLVLEKIITEFDNNGKKDTFNLPSGIFVTKDNVIYLADTQNNRVVVMKEDGSLIKILGKPEVTIFQGDFKYQPIRVAVDSADRVFVVSFNVSEGIIEYDSKGVFQSFFGSIRVKRDVSQIFWRALAEYVPQIKDQLTRNIPTEYSSLCLDEYNFILATAGIVSEKDAPIFIRRLNPMGIDVLRRNDTKLPPNGDPQMLAYNVAEKKVMSTFSKLVDIISRGNGIYSAIDERMGRIFTYNSNGDLMYIFGGSGTLFGQFGRAVALDVYDGQNYLVVDNKYNQIVTFKPTRYGQLITDAAAAYYKRDYETAGKNWSEAIKYTAKSRLIYNGYAKYLFKDGDYEDAMKFYKYAKNDKEYSDAYELDRKDFLDRYFVPIALTLLVLVAAFLIYRKIRKNRRAKND
ncbi:MAG: hypothetical protein ACYCYI_08545 [Saccharofermentanales bacterium]